MKTEEIALQFQLQTKYDTKKQLQSQLDTVNDEIRVLESTLNAIRTNEWNARYGTKIRLQDTITIDRQLYYAYVASSNIANPEDKYLIGSQAIIKQIDSENDRVLLSQDGCIRWFSGFMIRDAFDKVQA